MQSQKKFPVFFMCLLLAMALLGCVSAAGEALFIPALSAGELENVPVAAVSAMNEPEAHWFWSLLASDAASNLWRWVTTAGVAVLIGWFKLQGTRKERAILCLAQGVKETGDAWVRSAKKKSEDGKLTEEERRQANQEAIGAAIGYAKAEGFNLLKVFAKDSLPALVDSIVRRRKVESAASKLPLAEAPLSDLVPSLR